jgi:hypothetical protein
MRALLLQQGFSIVAESHDMVSENFAIHNNISFVWKGGGEKFGWLYVQSLNPEWLGHMLKVFASWGRYNSGSRSVIGGAGLSCMGIEWH